MIAKVHSPNFSDLLVSSVPYIIDIYDCNSDENFLFTKGWFSTCMGMDVGSFLFL
jgi:hypothetical protein